MKGAQTAPLIASGAKQSTWPLGETWIAHMGNVCVKDV
jgi:hypothetical protein